MKRLLLLVMACATLAPLSAQQRRAKQRELINNTQEIRLGTYALSPLVSFENYDGYDYAPSESFADSKFIEGDTRYIDALALTYTYRTSHVMEFGAQVSYSSKVTPFYSTFTGVKSHATSEHYATLMPYARATWLNSPWVRLYSSIGIGFTVAFDNGEQSDMLGAVQATPLGIAVGRKFFGYGELLTLGTNGFATIGIGYRF